MTRASAILDAVINIEPPGREARIDALCAGDAVLRAMVHAGLAHDVPDDAPFHAAINDALAAAANGVGAGHRVGPYRLVREIGRGGMGAVYLAARDDEEFDQQAAIKIVGGLLAPHLPGSRHDCAHCAREEPARRYASADAPADGLLRYLDGDTVRARPSTLGYRTAKAREARLPEGHWLRAYTDVMFGRALRASGAGEEAKPLIENGYRALSEALPPDDPRVRIAAGQRRGAQQRPVGDLPSR